MRNLMIPICFISLLIQGCVSTYTGDDTNQTQPIVAAPLLGGATGFNTNHRQTQKTIQFSSSTECIAKS